MTPLDLQGHLAYFFIFLGMLLISQKMQVGWFLRFLGEASWTMIGFEMGMSSIWAWGMVFMAVDVYGYWKWRR